MHLDELNEKITVITSLYKEFHEIFKTFGEIFAVDEENRYLFEQLNPATGKYDMADTVDELKYLLRRIENNEGESILVLFRIDPEMSIDNFKTIDGIVYEGLSDRLNDVVAYLHDQRNFDKLFELTKPIRAYSKTYSRSSHSEEYLNRAFYNNDKYSSEKFRVNVKTIQSIVVDYVLYNRKTFVGGKLFDPFNMISNPTIDKSMNLECNINSGLAHIVKYDWMLETDSEMYKIGKVEDEE